MTPRLLTRFRLVIARSQSSKRPTPRVRRSARAVLAWFVVGVFVFSTGLLLAGDVVWPELRDPEYGRRANALRDRVAENTGRPLVLVVGSSRVGAAVSPRELTPADPFLFNMGRAGAGPVVQLMMLRRAYAEGFRPAVVLLEYWPPFLTERNPAKEFRITPDHLFVGDLPIVREYHPLPGSIEDRMLRNRMNPISGLRRTLMLHIAPTWVPWPGRMEMVWAPLDSWGWLPMELPPGLTPEREQRIVAWEKTFRPQLQKFAVAPSADRALREAVALARHHGAEVGFVYLPESSEFRGWYPPVADETIAQHLQALSAELRVPVINGRLWTPDDHLVDGYHLSRVGAAELTRKLARAVTSAFPDAGVKP